MSDTREFRLPDLGEGLPDATVVEWHVQPGQSIGLDEPLVSMETAKAIVDVPSPFSGKLISVGGDAGAVIITGSVLATFELDPNAEQRSDAAGMPSHGGGHSAPPAAPAIAQAAKPAEAAPDAGTVVGSMQSSDAVRQEQAVTVGGVKALPAVRALARKLKVDLTQVTGHGSDGQITLKDVQEYAANPQPTQRGNTTVAVAGAMIASASNSRTALSASGKPMRTESPAAVNPSNQATGQPTPLAGVRRNMARIMADAHSKVVLTTIVDDADINDWSGKHDITSRLVRAIIQACHRVPALNAWFDGENLTRTLHPHVDLGIAVDSPDGLFVPVLRDAQLLNADGIKSAVKRLRNEVMDRSISADLLKGATISLSNFGVFAGRYATPVVMPPMVAIVGAGKLSHDVVAVIGGVEVHRRIPISLSFDHRVCTGGEAARFLRALLDDLEASH